MSWRGILAALVTLNLATLRLILRNSEIGRMYWSRAIRHYDELAGNGLVARDPVRFVFERGWGEVSPPGIVQIPTELTGGGTAIEELYWLGAVTHSLQPKRIFEIGTYAGLTTSVLILSAPPDASIFSLDLPLDSPSDLAKQDGGLKSDWELIRSRKLASLVYSLHLQGRYQQLLCDSLNFDPQPYAGTVELGFIDGAHSRIHVENDTKKMAIMVAQKGLVFWHDYGGRGTFAPLTDYLDSLSRQIQIYRVPGTSLAWSPADELRRLSPSHSG